MPEVIAKLELDSIEMVSIVDKGASGNKRLRPSIVIVKRKGAIMNWLDKAKAALKISKGELKSPEEILQTALGDMPEEKQDQVMAAVAAMIAQAGGTPAPAPAAPEPGPEEPADKQDEGEEEDPLMKGDDEELHKILKSAAPELKAMLAKSIEIAKAAKKEAEETKAELSELRKTKKKEELTSLVAKLEHVPGKPEAIVKVLEGLDDENRKAMTELLESTDRIIAKGGKDLFSELGTARGGADDSDAASEVHKRASEIVAKEGISMPQAIAKVYNQDPSLYARQRNESAAAE